MSESPTAFEQVSREKIEQIEVRLTDALSNFSVNVRDLWEAIQELRTDMRDRVQTWVMWVISVQGAIIGAMATYILERLLK